MRRISARDPRHGTERFLAVLLGLALALAACGGDDDEASTGTAEDASDGNEDSADDDEDAAPAEGSEGRDTVVLTSQNDPGQWDVTASAAADVDRWVLHNVFESLIVFDDAGEPQPGLAESWTMSDDGTELVFDIREATFHNGDAVTMDDVLFSLNLNFDSPRPVTQSAYAVVESIDLVDDRSVQFTLSGPSRSFLLELGSVGGIVHPESTYGDIAQNPVGAGPFSFSQYVPDSNLVLERFDDYYGDTPAMREVEVRFIPEPAAGLNAMRAGEVDGFPNLAEELFSRIADESLEDEFKLVSTEVFGRIITLRANANEGPLADVGVRAALMHALDREEIVAVHGADFAYTTACMYGTADLPYFGAESEDTCVYPAPDLDRVAELLDEAVYSGEPIEFTYISDWVEAEVISAQLEAAGFNIERNPMERARFLDEVNNVFPMTTDLFLIAGRAYLQSFARPDLDDGSEAYFFSEEFNELIAEAEATVDIDEWSSLMAEADQIFQEQGTVPMIASQAIMALFDPDLRGWGEDSSFVHYGNQSFKLRTLSWE